MSEETAQTLNGDPGVNQEVGGLVSTDHPNLVPDQTNLTSDLDDMEAEQSAPSAADDKTPVDAGDGASGDTATDKEADGAESEQTDAEAKPTRFDQHPDWQRMMRERDEARLALMEAQSGTTGGQQATETLPYKDTSKMSDEEFSDWILEDPRGWAENLKAEAAYAARVQFGQIQQADQFKASQEAAQAQIIKEYEEFEAAHPDFRKMWDSQEIMQYIEQHPVHNPISAYYKLTDESRTAAAIEKAKKEAEAATEKRFRSKTKASVLTGGPSAAPLRGEAEDPRLSNTKGHGGMTSVLADRLAALRRGV